MSRGIRFGFFGVLLALSGIAGAAEWSGRVVGVHDGDTLTVKKGTKAVKVRLVEIDAPELGQAYGKTSKKTLSGYCFNKRAKVVWTQKDRYNRILGRVTCGAIDANAQQIAQGMAWWYVDYGIDLALNALEAQAQSLCLGLWADPAPVPPWDYRKDKHATGIPSGCDSSFQPDQPPMPTPTPTPIPKPTPTPTPPPTPSNPPVSGPACGTKTTCGQMSSCSEANFFLNQCGVSRLDADSDGIPCETICK